MAYVVEVLNTLMPHYSEEELHHASLMLRKGEEASLNFFIGVPVVLVDS